MATALAAVVLIAGAVFAQSLAPRVARPLPIPTGELLDDASAELAGTNWRLEGPATVSRQAVRSGRQGWRLMPGARWAADVGLPATVAQSYRFVVFARSVEPAKVELTAKTRGSCAATVSRTTAELGASNSFVELVTTLTPTDPGCSMELDVRSLSASQGPVDLDDLSFQATSLHESSFEELPLGKFLRTANDRSWSGRATVLASSPAVDGKLVMELSAGDNIVQTHRLHPASSPVAGTVRLALKSTSNAGTIAVEVSGPCVQKAQRPVQVTATSRWAWTAMELAPTDEKRSPDCPLRIEIAHVQGGPVLVDSVSLQLRSVPG